MDPIVLVTRASKTPAFPDPAGAITPTENDANLNALKTAAEQLDAEKLGADQAVAATSRPGAAEATDLFIIQRGAAVHTETRTQLEASLSPADNAVTNAKLADMATATIKGRNTAGTGDPEDLTATQVRTLLNVADGATANASDAALRDRATHTGTQASSTISDFNSATRAQAEAMLVAGANVTLTPSGTGATRQITIAAAGGGGATNLSYTAATRVIASDTGTDATLPLVSAGDAGLAPASGGGTTNFLRADGTWAAPAGGGSSPLGLWDWWYSFRPGNNAAPASDYFQASAINSGTNTNFPPNASTFGYNSHGVLLRSSTTADGGWRYQGSNGSDYFGATSRKFRCQLTSIGSFTGRTIRVGFHNTTTVADAVDGAYFEIVAGVASCKTAENSVRTTDATTYTMALDTAYTLDIDIPAGGGSKRFRIYAGTSTTAVLDVTITDTRLTDGTRRTNVGIVATESSTTASDILILHSLGVGTVEGFTRAMG